MEGEGQCNLVYRMVSVDTLHTLLLSSSSKGGKLQYDFDAGEYDLEIVDAALQKRLFRETVAAK